MIQIFAEDILNDGSPEKNLQDQVNACITENAGATVQWLQSSGGSQHTIHTVLTAIVNIPDSQK